MRHFAAAALVAAALAAAPAAANATTVSTVPRVGGVHVILDGHEYTSNARGEIDLPAASRDLQTRLRVQTTTLKPGVEARFSRWYRGRIALAFWYRITPVFLGSHRAPVAQG